MDMYNCQIVFQENYGVGRWFMAFGYHLDGVEIKWNLMIDTAQRRIRDTTPASADRPVYVAKEQMADIVMSRQDLANMVTVGPQSNAVDAS